jgi:hypothetical protein
VAPSTAIVRQLTGLSRIAARIRPQQKPQTNGDMSNYFGPGISVVPIAPPGTEARGWQYWVNQNMIFTPRPDAEFTAQQLRDLARYPLHRIAIENAKDIISNMPRQIRAKKKPGEKNVDVDKRSQGDATLKMLNDFFDCPDGEHDWGQWVREWLEAVYVIDAPAVLVRRTRGGQVAQLRNIDGAFINRLVDEWGYTPQPPDPAYQQLWSGTPSTVGGIPFTDLTIEQLVYRPRNIVPRNTVSSFLYGYPPTEQNAQEIMIGQERLNFVLAWYTSGQMPDLLHVVPPGISADLISSTQKTIEAELSGQAFKRSGTIRMIQGFVDRTQPGASSGDQFVNPKEKLFADPFDEMHIRKIFYGIGVSPQRILKAMNRASAQAGQEAAEEEGTMPVAMSARDNVNWIIAKIFGFGFNAYEMTFEEPKELDAVKRSTAAKNDVDAGIITRDEERAARGLDPMGGDAATLMITTPTGTVPVNLKDQVQHAKDMFAAKPPLAPMPQNGKQPVGKRAQLSLDPARHSPESRQAQARLESSLAHVFMRQKEKAAVEASRLLKRFGKADDSEEKADSIYRAIEDEFRSIPAEARAALEAAALSGISNGFLQIELSDANLLSSVNTLASEYAAKRAAELVGMKYTEDGELIENPNAKWSISSTTRDRLREIVKGAFEEKTPYSEVIDDIRNADIFSESRATMIAKTEVQNAQVRSNFNVWEKSGLVNKVKWLAVGPDPCPICEANDSLVRSLGDAFPSGDKYPTAHPRCECILQAVGFNG